MSKQTSPDLIENICEGKGTRFHGVQCQFYANLARECDLLKGQQIQVFWDHGRCAYIVLQIVEEGCMKTIHEMYADLIPDDAFDYDIQAVVHRLKHQELTAGFSLPVWHRYVYTTVYREIKRQLPMLPDKRHCGTCKHLSKSTDYICEHRHEIHASLRICDEYARKPDTLEVVENIDCMTCQHLSRKSYFCYFHREKRNKTDDLCENYSAEIVVDFISLNDDATDENAAHQSPQPNRLLHEISQIQAQTTLSAEDQVSAEDELNHIRTLLQDRIETAAAGSKRREMYERQYELFFQIVMKMCDDDLEEDDAIQAIAKEFGIKEWTLRRDIRDAREFLLKNA
ncbi:hypothetical protein U14_01394 [Candidatus Moduliflexus flocculans]|uniref:Uncharacterized protein n=1 Tax=Candidatus Moduliflexus flocculans TaxID=1499966 RepID=A0A0S6VS85_9BACT|nr:hypothetical protein U14_01394 [Candidatus Moduliflexus flocculans]